jgi:hypothetical protein
MNIIKLKNDIKKKINKIDKEFKELDDDLGTELL